MEKKSLLNKWKKKLLFYKMKGNRWLSKRKNFQIKIKKIDFREPRSIVTKIILFLAAAMLLFSFMAVGLIGFTVGTMWENKEKEHIRQINETVTALTEDYIDKYAAIAVTLSKNGEVISLLEATDKQNSMRDYEKYAEIVNTLLDVKVNFNNINSLYIGSVAEDSYIDEVKTYLPESFSLKNAPYYRAIEEKKKILTEPYENVVTGKLCITIAVPVYSDGGDGVIGLIGLDINLSNMEKFLSDNAFGETGKSMIVDSNDQIIAYTDSSLSGKRLSEANLDASLLEGIQKADGELISYNFSGEQRVGFAQREENFGWTLVTGMDKKEYKRNTNRMVWILVSIQMAAMAVLAVLLSQRIRKFLIPLRELEIGMKVIAEGTLNQPVQYKSNDEFGRLADSMREMTSSLSMYIKEIEEAMKSLELGYFNLSFSREFQGDFREIEHCFTKFIYKISEDLLQVNRASGEVLAGAEQISCTSQSMAQGAASQAEQVQRMTAVLGAVSGRIAETARNVTFANEVVQNVKEGALNSNEQVKMMLCDMEEISKESKEIKKIMKVIEGIAFQTKVLALNAAVEAARAGNAGRGFAVVAGEVRNLASKVSDSASDINQLIEGSMKAIQKGVVTAAHTADSMEGVVLGSKKIAAMIGEIEESAQEQAEAASKINSGLEEISGIVQTNSAASEETASASEQLSEQSQNLNKLVNQFILKEAAPC